MKPGLTIAAILPDGSQVDVTEGVQAAYDLVLGSLDFQSGFLTIEDILPLRELAEACGFDQASLDAYDGAWLRGLK